MLYIFQKKFTQKVRHARTHQLELPEHRPLVSRSGLFLLNGTFSLSGSVWNIPNQNILRGQGEHFQHSIWSSKLWWRREPGRWRRHPTGLGVKFKGTGAPVLLPSTSRTWRCSTAGRTHRSCVGPGSRCWRGWRATVRGRRRWSWAAHRARAPWRCSARGLCCRGWWTRSRSGSAGPCCLGAPGSCTVAAGHPETPTLAI